MIIPQPLPSSQYITADGKLTLEGMKLFQQLARVLADHEARIGTLEP